jgi:hypothetical protein
VRRLRLAGGGDRVARYADLSPEAARRRHRRAGRQVVLDQRAHPGDDLRLQCAVQGRVDEDGKVHGVKSGWRRSGDPVAASLSRD